MTENDVLARIERYYDTAPRAASRTEEVGPFTLFLGRPEGWPYYARPRLGWTGPVSAADVAAVRARQVELSVPEAIEWVDETTPQLRPAVQAQGMPMVAYPLMRLDASLEVGMPPGVTVRRVSSDDGDLAQVQAVLEVGFGASGTEWGTAGPAERDAAAARRPPEADAFWRTMLSEGHTVAFVAEDASGLVAAGSHQPRGDVTEVTGIATLPTARRRGIGAAVTAALVQDAQVRGVQLVFLSAGGDDVARVYARIGFRIIATACIAEA